MLVVGAVMQLLPNGLLWLLQDIGEGVRAPVQASCHSRHVQDDGDTGPDPMCDRGLAAASGPLRNIAGDRLSIPSASAEHAPSAQAEAVGSAIMETTSNTQSIQHEQTPAHSIEQLSTPPKGGCVHPYHVAPLVVLADVIEKLGVGISSRCIPQRARPPALS